MVHILLPFISTVFFLSSLIPLDASSGQPVIAKGVLIGCSVAALRRNTTYENSDVKGFLKCDDKEITLNIVDDSNKNFYKVNYEGAQYYISKDLIFVDEVVKKPVAARDTVKAFEKIERDLTKMSDPPCPKCPVEASSIKKQPKKIKGDLPKFEACTWGKKPNGYLQWDLKNIWKKDISKMIKKFGLSEDELTTNDLAHCITRALKQNIPLGKRSKKTGCGGYFECKPGSKKGALKSLPLMPRPCASEELVKSINAEITMVAECIDLDIKELLSLFNHESRFQVIRLTKKCDAGVGQITGGAIENINKLYGVKGRREKFSGKCSYINDVVGKNRIAKKDNENYCARVSIPPGPRRNIVYSSLYLKEKFRDADDILLAWQSGCKLSREGRKKCKRAKKGSKSSPDYKLMRREIARASYNGGGGMVNAAFRVFDDKMKQNCKFSHWTIHQHETKNKRKEKDRYGRYGPIFGSSKGLNECKKSTKKNFSCKFNMGGKNFRCMFRQLLVSAYNIRQSLVEKKKKGGVSASGFNPYTPRYSSSMDEDMRGVEQGKKGKGDDKKCSIK